MRHLQAAIRALCLGMILPLGAFLGLLLSTSRDAPPPTVALAPIKSDPEVIDSSVADRTVTLRRTLGRAEVEERRVLPVASRLPATEPTFERAPFSKRAALPVAIATSAEDQEPLSPVRPVLEDPEDSAPSPAVTELFEGPRLPSLLPETVQEPRAPSTLSASRTPEPTTPKHARQSPRSVTPPAQELPPRIPREAFEEPAQVALASPPTLTPPELDAHPTPSDGEPDPTQSLPPLEPPAIEELAPPPPTPTPTAPAASRPVSRSAPREPQKLPAAVRKQMNAPTPKRPPRKVVVDATVVRVLLAPTTLGVRLESLENDGVHVLDVPRQTQSEIHHALLHGDPARVVEAITPFGQATIVSRSSLSAMEGQPALLNVGRRRAGDSPELVLTVRVRPQVTPDGAIRLDVLPERFLGQSAAALSATASNSRIGPGETLVTAGLRESSLESADARSTWLVRAEWLVLLTPRLAD